MPEDRRDQHWGPYKSEKLNPTGMQDLNADFVSLRRRHFDLFDLQRLAGTPAYGSLALNRLASGIGHGNVWAAKFDGQVL
jgi:hypothetical protein